MGLYQRIQFYKSLLMIFWCVNVVLICVTLLASFRFFKNNKAFESSLQNQKQIVSVLSLDSELGALSALPIVTEDQVYEYRKRTDSLKRELLAIPNLPTEIRSFAESSRWKMSVGEWSKLRTALMEWVKTQLSGGEANFESIGRTTTELLFLGIFTLVFGIFLPLLVFALLTKNLLKAKKGFEEKLSIWIARVIEKIPTDKGNPWGNPLLWFEVVLAGFEIFAPQTRHPIILLLKDFIPTVRNEFSKAKTGESTNGST